MKYEFKEGQWFDIRKFTDWQKQWCLDNLNFTEWAIILFKEEDVPLYRYKGESFMSTSIGHLHIKNEITFNDFYWSQEDESFDNLVYVEPAYIDNDSYYTLSKSQMSTEQWSFVIDNIPLKEGCNGSDEYLNMDPHDSVWFDNDEMSESQDIYITFNHIFQEVN
jgi:hypothetical protein